MNAGSIILGIDLGTSFSTACAWIDGRPHFVTDARNEACIPSVVHFPRHGPPIVGTDADKMRATDPTNTVFGIKRLLGCRSKDSPAARLIDAIAAYKLVDRGDGAVSVAVRSGTFHAAEIASIIMRHLKERAEMRFGRGIRQAVITHPVTASRDAIQATVLAAKLGGLEVIRTVAEPCAGALAAGACGEKPRKMVVFDFGGGTLDVTVIAQSALRFDVLSAGGDELLGGDDFDRAMADRIADVIWRSRSVEIRHDAIQWESLHRRCELAKRALSVRSEARLHLEDSDFELTVERRDMESTWASLVQRAMERTAATLVEAGFKPRDLDVMVPIGGTTYIPMVRAGLERVFQMRRVDVADAQTAVAAGAAMIGAKAAELRVA